ncbi:MAG: hypothetical protein ACYS5V_16185, partial [Planctomycetota bacterium]
NVRLAEPDAAPDAATLLDFGPDNQVLWPGFEHAGLEARNVTWSGRAKIIGLAQRYPDPLTGDFAGPRLGYKVQESVSVRSDGGAGRAWLWVTHFSNELSHPLEHMVKVNGRAVHRQRMSASRMLSIDGLLSGFREPWTPEWFEKTLTPRVVTRLDVPLKAGANRVDLANCQLAAMIIAPRARAREARRYVARLEADLTRYRRQFVLAVQRPPRCDVVPTQAEVQSGVMLFTPPPDDWLFRRYVPLPEHRDGTVKITAVAGSAGLGAFVAIPCRDGRIMRTGKGVLRGPGQAGIQASDSRVQALETVPVVDDAAVEYQPYLMRREVRSPRARSVHWFVVRVNVPETARSGLYRGAVRVILDVTESSVPVEVNVVRFPGSVPDPKATFGVRSSGDCFHAYRSLRHILPPARKAALDRQIVRKLSDGGMNACGLTGPALMGPNRVLTVAPLAGLLKNRVWLEGRGGHLIDMAMVLTRVGPVEPGTGKYRDLMAKVVKEVDKVAGKYGFDDYALFCGYLYRATDVARTAKIVREVRRVGGRPALGAHAHVLNASRASWPELGLAQIAEAFKKNAPGGRLLVISPFPDTYTFGFYSWGVGADGSVTDLIFSRRPIFDAFWFDGRSLLVPDERWGFEPTVSMLTLGQAMADYRLGRRCEALAAAARKRNIEPRELDLLLTEIRLAAAGAQPAYSLARLRTTQVTPSQLHQWRSSLATEAAKLIRKMSGSRGLVP